MTTNLRSRPGLAPRRIEGAPPTLSVVVPCYNEAAALPLAAGQLSGLLDLLVESRQISRFFEIIFVDDGSIDTTWSEIERLCADDTAFRGVKLSRNRGHQNALLAGLFAAAGDVVISVDADLQDDIGAIASMLEQHTAGYDVVYGVRARRDADTFLKRTTAEAYYRLLGILGVEVVFNHADFRLLSRPVIEALREFKEVNLFLRGMIPQLGFSATTVSYSRRERIAGESKYHMRRMLALAWQGVTSFSAVPLRVITALGFIVSAGSFAVTLWALGVRLLSDQAVPGWASTVLPIYFLGGIQLLSIGVIGEYISKIFEEAKGRPRYIVEKAAGRGLIGQ